MRRAGRVVALGRGGTLLVELDEAPCARCAGGRGCGALRPGAAPPRLECAAPDAAPAGRRRRAAPPHHRPAIGSRVELEIEDDGRWLGGVLLAYGLPTLGLLGGAFAPEPWTPLGALAGLCGGILAWRVAERAVRTERPSPARAAGAPACPRAPSEGASPEAPGRGGGPGPGPWSPRARIVSFDHPEPR